MDSSRNRVGATIETLVRPQEPRRETRERDAMQPAARRPCVLIICTEYILYEWLAGHLAENVGLIATSNFWLAAEVT